MPLQISRLTTARQLDERRDRSKLIPIRPRDLLPGSTQELRRLGSLATQTHIRSGNRDLPSTIYLDG